MDLRYESLHNHTTASDGKMTHRQLLNAAEKHNFGVMAFTEHDSLPTADKVKELKQINSPVDWLIGIEISSGWPQELGGGAASMFHILGLFVDPTNQDLRQHCQKMVSARKERMERMVKNLQNLGFDISVDDCLEESGGEAVGRPHIVSALWKREHNRKVIDSLRDQMRQAAGKDAEIKESYQAMMEQEEKNHPYSLFLAGDAFISDVYVDYLYSTDMDTSVELIRQAGGVAVLAHWPTVMEKIDQKMLGKFLAEDRLDGVEYTSLFVANNYQEKANTLKQLAEENDSLTTVGVDTHEAEELAEFAETDVVEETVGMTQNLIEQIQPDLRWSTFE